MDIQVDRLPLLGTIMFYQSVELNIYSIKPQNYPLFPPPFLVRYYPALNGNVFMFICVNDPAEEMTPADVSLAQAMARECMSSGYTDCGW
jgi:hypothetical protein